MESIFICEYRFESPIKDPLLGVRSIATDDDDDGGGGAKCQSRRPLRRDSRPQRGGRTIARRRGHSTARSSASERGSVRVRRFYPNHEYHPFSEGTLSSGVAKRCGEFKSFLENAACTCTSCSRIDPISSDDTGDLHPGKSSKSRPQNYGRGEETIGEREEKGKRLNL